VKRIPFNLEQYSKFPVKALDTETTGLYWYRDKVFGIALTGYDPKEQIIMSQYWDIRDNPRIITALNREFQKCDFLCNHNMKFDALMCKPAGIILPDDRLQCTSVRAALINEHEFSFSLDALAEKYLGMNKDNEIYAKLAELFGGKDTRNVQINNLHRAPVELVGKYATVDTELAAMLWVWQEAEIEKQGLQRVWDLERRVLPVLLDMERRGVRVDVAKTERALDESRKMATAAQRELDKVAGKPLNVNSSPQIRAIFGAYADEQGNWKTESGAPLEVTDSGNPSFDADALRLLETRGDPIAAKILALRKATKAQSFLKDHILGHEVNGRVYPNYNQTRGDNDLGTGTGRFSINDPALQQIPARDIEIASVVRACFIPDDGCDWACSDWEQFEFRWFAHYTKDKRIEKLFADNPSTDFHQLVSDLTGIPRKPRYAGDANAKQINLGMVFGMGDGRLAAEMGMPYTVNKRGYLEAGPETLEVVGKYHAEIPGVKLLQSDASSIARSRGYVQTAMGRHLRFPGGKYVHKAAGLVFQGTSADCMKLKMVQMHDVSKATGFDMLLSVHDELDFSVPKGMRKEVEPLIRKTMEDFNEGSEIVCRIPIRSSIEFADNWWDASK
jgi:DNA polymerase I-like protein with 3'-5' exonuclease and polymerase domains